MFFLPSVETDRSPYMAGMFYDNYRIFTAVLCWGDYTTAQPNPPYDYLSSALKIVPFGSDDGAIYGETRLLFRWTS